jgi:RimJ/RimL family protein N-acetyltransferase
MNSASVQSSSVRKSIQPVTGPDEADRLEFDDLSDFFNPFLHHFVREALRGHGEVMVSRQGANINGLLIYNIVERIASIFTRDREVAESLFGTRESLATFSDFSLTARTETYHVYAAERPGNSNVHRFAHPVRLARAGDHPAIERMLQQMYGRIDTSWFGGVSRAEEKCFVVDVGGEIAGVGWVSVVGDRSRLHSLSVRPRYRRMGIGTDLWHARVLWAWEAGAHQVMSEISEHNAASVAIAEQGGMQKIGRLTLSYRPEGPPAPPSG